MIDCGLIAEALAAYDPDAQEPSIVKAEEQRAEFTSRFPKWDWPTMTLERYALGQTDQPDNFGRWLEFVATELGSMKGGSARKHLIYLQAQTGEWWFDRKAYDTVEDAWEAVRAGFIRAIQAAEAGDWAAIENIPALSSGPALVNKMLSIYLPDQLLPINSQSHLRHFLKELREPRADDRTLGTTRLNRLLLEGLRDCNELDGWTTKQMERLLYTTLDPRTTEPPPGPISDVAEFIATTLEEAGDDRLEERRQAEDQARKLLDDFAGEMTEEQARKLLKLFNADFHNGKRTNVRFSPAFVGQTANGLVANLDNFNHWTKRVWSEDPDAALTAVGELLSNRKALPSAGSSYPTMLMYLRNPETSAVWLQITDRGLQRLTGYQPTKSPGSGRPADYVRFCEAAGHLMADYDIPPELLDYLLAAAGRPDDSDTADTDSLGVWVFQANPSIYDIDHALSEVEELIWVVRQSAKEVKMGDRVYLWRSGGDAGVVATATVKTDPKLQPGDPDDPYVLKPEALSKRDQRVVLDIDSVLPSVIRRSYLLEHSVLKDLGVIRFANATNYRVTPEQDRALQILVSGFRVPPLRDEIEDRVHLPRKWLQDALDLLVEKGQIVFYGPPGTGKTFVALALAEEITREGGDFRIVQFHPSYSYEDFVGGFRPVEDAGTHGVRYQRTSGPFRELAGQAAGNPGRPYLLIVDEINRGNIPRIFGELLFLLEYRQKSVRLQYWPEEEFRLPTNLFMIGTMNTADRSIALVDAALRRRFYFQEFNPTAPPVSEVLRKWLAKHGHEDDPARLLNVLNEEIASEEIAIGPSYFMTDAETGPDLERIWERAIMPLLEEYYYGTTWERQRFSLEKLKARVNESADQAATDADQPPSPSAEAGEGATAGTA